MAEIELSAAAREARRVYQRQYYAQNRERIKETQARYWARKAAQAEYERQKAAEIGGKKGNNDAVPE